MAHGSCRAPGEAGIGSVTPGNRTTALQRRGEGWRGRVIVEGCWSAVHPAPRPSASEGCAWMSPGVGFQSCSNESPQTGWLKPQDSRSPGGEAGGPNPRQQGPGRRWWLRRGLAASRAPGRRGASWPRAAPSPLRAPVWPCCHVSLTGNGTATSWF